MKMDFALLMKQKHRYATLLAKAQAAQNDLAIRAVAYKIAKLNRMIQHDTQGNDPRKD